MAYTYEKIVQGNYSCGRIAKAVLTPGSKEVASLDTAIDFTNTMAITPNPGAPAEISYVEVKNSRGVTVKAEQNNTVVKAADGSPASSGTEATLQVQMMTSPAKREILAASAKAGDVYACMFPAGILANGLGTAGWYHLLGKLTEVSYGDLNDETIQDITVTFTGVLGYTAKSDFDYTDYNTAMTGTIQQFGYVTTDVITPTAIVAGDFTNIMAGNLVAVGVPTD